jgi:hypothetical protein
MRLVLWGSSTNHFFFTLDFFFPLPVALACFDALLFFFPKIAS